MMKKLGGVIAAALIAVVSCISASADMISIFPKGIHEDLGTYRYFLMTDDRSVYKNYDCRDVAAKLYKGDIISINELFYLHAEKFGMYCYDGDHLGYVEMIHTALIYDHFSFMEEHEQELSDYDGELDDFEPNEQTVLWLSPLSSAYSAVPEEELSKAEWLDYIEFGSRTWTDENGGKWVYLGDGAFRWIYLPDPSATDISGRESYLLVSESKNGAVDDPRTAVIFRKDSPEKSSDMTAPIILACAAVVASAAVIAVIKSKKKKE